MTHTKGIIQNPNFTSWTFHDLTAAIASDEGVLAKEGDSCFLVNRDELAAMKRERTARWVNDNR